MRLLASYKLLLGLLLVVVAFEWVRLIDEDLVAVVHVWILQLHADPHHPVVRFVVRKVSSEHVETLEEVVFLTGFLGGMHLIEGFGLWLKKRWADSPAAVVRTAAAGPREPGRERACWKCVWTKPGGEA